MATINTGNIIQSRFIGSPISVPVTSANPPGNVTFHRVRLKVKITEPPLNRIVSDNDAEFEFTKPCGNSQTVWFDISSAFLAYVDGYIPSPTTFSYPSLTAKIEAVEDYLIDGISYEGESSSGEKTVSGKYIGALTDRERGAGISNSRYEPERYGRKPATSPEIVFIGKSILRPGALMDGVSPLAPSVEAISVVSGADQSHNCYGITAPRDGYEIRFINSLGVHENIFVSRLTEKEVHIDSEKYVIAREETLTRFSRGTIAKQNDYETWKFSSGPLDEAWVSWYIHEFMMTKWVWIYINGMWIPCHTKPEEGITLVNRENASMMEVQFDLEMDINGSPL